MMKKKDNTLLKPEQAVESYLDNLLQEIPAESSEAKPLELKDNIVLLPDFEIAEEVNDPAVEETIEADSSTIVTAHEVAEEEEAPQESSKERKLDFSYPIQCLMFQAANTQLSIPLIELGSVVPWVDNMTQLPSSQHWSLGVLQHRERNIRVVDTAGILNIKKSNTDENHPRHILVFGEGDWGLSCDSLGEVVNVESDDIQWSGPKSPGLNMGTIKSSLAQLLDPIKVMRYLDSVTRS